MEDMQQAVDTMRMYCATWIGTIQHGRASIHLALLLLLLLLLSPSFVCCQLPGIYSYIHIRIRFSSFPYCCRQVAF